MHLLAGLEEGEEREEEEKERERDRENIIIRKKGRERRDVIKLGWKKED